MSWTAYVALFTWTPLALVLYAAKPGRGSALAVVVLGYLLLPQAVISLPGAVDMSRSTTIGLGLILGVVLFDSRRLQGVQFRSYDTFMMAWCVAPLFSSLTNDLGAYDGIAGSLGAALTFGVPYLVGRLYIRSADDVRALAIAVIAGGILYVPLCWFEIRFSPNLHYYVYGFQQHVFAQTRRLGGWRPMVFLEHGLAVGMWMTAATVSAYGLWRSRQLPPWLGLRPWMWFVVLAVTLVFCKSLGSILLAVVGLVAVWACLVRRSVLPLLVLSLVSPVYLAARVLLRWDPQGMASIVREFSQDRAQSLEGRIATDALVREHALQKPLFGWGGWNRFRQGLPPILTDSLWSITLGQKGLLGLASLFGLLAAAQVRPLLLLRRLRGRPSDNLPLVAMVAALCLHTMDCLVNAHTGPAYFLIAGGLIGCDASWISNRVGTLGHLALHGPT